MIIMTCEVIVTRGLMTPAVVMTTTASPNMMKIEKAICATIANMAAERMARQPWTLRRREAVAMEDPAKVDVLLEAYTGHDDQKSAATIVPGGSGEQEQRSSTSVAEARAGLARRRV